MSHRVRQAMVAVVFADYHAAAGFRPPIQAVSGRSSPPKKQAEHLRLILVVDYDRVVGPGAPKVVALLGMRKVVVSAGVHQHVHRADPKRKAQSIGVTVGRNRTHSQCTTIEG